MDTATAMRRALELSAAGLGSTAPNPCVGAVVLDAAGELVGVGRTAPPPGPHAEVVALAQAGDRARGGTVITTLEPCAGTGRTGPCTEALLAAGVASCVYALADPLPGFSGGGHRLAEAGLHVQAGVAADEARRLLGPWLTAVSRGRPYLTWKLATSLDGRVAAADASSRWITGPAARADAHRLRGQVDAILVGSGTVLADDPALTVRGTDEPRSPLRVAFDRRGRVPADARMLTGGTPSLVLAEDLEPALKLLFARGVRHGLVEGGPRLAGALLAAGLIDELVVYLAPALLGAGPAALATDAFPTIDQALRTEFDDITRLGPDLRLTARLTGES